MCKWVLNALDLDGGRILDLKRGLKNETAFVPDKKRLIIVFQLSILDLQTGFLK